MSSYIHETPILKSARLADHALHGRAPAPEAETSSWALFAVRVYHHPFYRWPYAFIVSAHLLLALVELPSLTAQQLSSGSAVAVKAADCFVLFLVAFDLALQAIYHSPIGAIKRGWVLTKFISWSALVINLILHSGSGGSIPYVARLVRPVFIVERLRNVRKIVASIVDTTPRIVNVGLLLFLNLVIHAVLGFVLFSGMDEKNCTRLAKPPTVPQFCSTMLSPPQSCNNFFSSLGETTMHLFEAMTAVNFPGIALPVMRCSVWNGLFFISFNVTAVYLLFNLALVVAYSEFSIGIRGEVLTRFARVFAGLDMVFSILSSIKEGTQDNIVPWKNNNNNNSNSTTSGGGGIGGGRGNKKNEARISKDAFCEFFIAFRRDLTPEESRSFASLLFEAFATKGATSNNETSVPVLDVHAFRRLMISCARVIPIRNPSSQLLDDYFASEDEEIMFEGHVNHVNLMNHTHTSAVDVSRGGVEYNKSNIILPGDMSAVNERESTTAVSSSSEIVDVLSSSDVEKNSNSTSTTRIVLNPLSGATAAASSSSSSSSTNITTTVQVAAAADVSSLMDARKLRVQQQQLQQQQQQQQQLKGAIEPSTSKDQNGSVSSDLQSSSSSSSSIGHERGGGWMSSWTLFSESWIIPIADHSAFALAFDFTTVLTAVCVFAQLILDTQNASQDALNAVSALRNVQIFCTIVGCLFVYSRVIAWGPVRYWRRGGLNRFDLVAITLLVVSQIIYSGEQQSGAAIPLVIRFLRLPRVFRFVPGFSSTVLAFLFVLPVLAQISLVLIALFYAFAIVGMTAFAGILVQSNPAVAISSFGFYGYYKDINFDNLPNAFFSLFYMLGVNDWVVLMEGCVAATNVGARSFFVVFWILVVLFLFNIVIALFTVSFGAEKARRDELDSTRGSRKSQRELAALSASSSFEGTAANMTLLSSSSSSTSPPSTPVSNEGMSSSSSSIVNASYPLPSTPSLQSPVFYLNDWRRTLRASGVSFKGYLITRYLRADDVYDALFRDDIIATFTETVA